MFYINLSFWRFRIYIPGWIVAWFAILALNIVLHLILGTPDANAQPLVDPAPQQQTTPAQCFIAVNITLAAPNYWAEHDRRHREAMRQLMPMTADEQHQRVLDNMRKLRELDQERQW